ncbi:MAG: hypothetical protein KME10_28055 [Plectolyngbya sp. WJT66-NPBG17]|nr:hypothetical protein [Plectolyngbya sp. WJT66-NPBG17]
MARLMLEECELLIGSESGVVLRAISAEARSFEPIMPVVSLPLSECLINEIVISQASTALQAQRSIEIYGTGFATIALLRSLAEQSELRNCYPHGILYLDKTDPVEDLVQTIFEQFYRVALDEKPSKAELRSGLCDRQALILLDHSTLTPSELNQLEQLLPNSTFAIASIERRFSQIDCAIEVSDPKGDLHIVSESENSALELLATIGVSLKAEQIRAIANVSNSELNRLIDLKVIRVEQERYKLQRNYQSSEAWMEKALVYVLDWLRTRPDAIVQERELLIITVQWAAKQRRSSEVIEIVRSIETAFAIAKLWGTWSNLLRWSLAAAWAVEDEAIEAWALHQLGTLAFCQQEITTGYDTLRDALALRTDLNDQTAIVFSQHNLAEIKALIVPVNSKNSLRTHQRHFYWIVGIICAIAVSVSIGVSILNAQHQSPRRNDRSSLSRIAFELVLSRFS